MTVLSGWDRAGRKFGREDVRLVWTLVGAGLLVWSAVGGQSPYDFGGGPSLPAMGGILIQLIVLMDGEAESDLPTIITWGLTAPLMVVQGRSVFVVVALVAILKALYVGFRRKIKPGHFLSGLALIVLQIGGEISTGKGPALTVATVTSMLLVFVAISWFYDWSRIDVHACRVAFIVTSLLCIAGSLAAARGDIGQFVVASDNTTRLGEAARGLGGSMGIPLYAVASISLIVLSDLRGRLRNRILAYLLVAVFTAAGVLTISRVFLLGLGVLIAIISLSILSRRRKYGLRVLASLAGIGLAGVLVFQAELLLLGQRLVQRTAEAGLDSGRLAIFDDALSLLSQNPRIVVVGQGAVGYVYAAQAQNSLVGSMLHNLLFDVIFSWGIVGAIALLTVLLGSMRRAAHALQAPIDMLTLVPGLVLGACLMTGGSMWYFSSYVFLWVATILCLDAGHSEDGTRMIGGL